MSTLIKAVVVSFALTSGAVAVQADVIDDLSSTGQILQPFGTDGGYK